MIRRSLAVLAIFAAAAVAQQKKRPPAPPPAAPPAKVVPADPAKTVFPIESLSVVGNKKISTPRIIAASGLKIGQPALQKDFDAARDRLVATGAFLSVAYEFKPSASEKGYDGVFQVVELEPLFGIVFEEMPLPDAQLRAALREREPLLGDELPGSKEMIARYVADLEFALEAAGKPAKVTGRIISDDRDHPLIVFRPPGARPSISRVQFAGNKVLPSTLLVNTLAGVAIGTQVSEASIRRMLEASIRPLYEARGRIRVSFPKFTTEKDDKVDGVVLNVTVEEGASYNLGSVRVTGIPQGEADRLQRVANFKPGDIANFDEINAGVDRIRARLKDEGYLRVAANMERKINEADHTVDLVVTMSLGPRFVYGKLEIKGLDLISEPVIRKMWGAREGKPFNPGFPDAFLNDIREQGLFDNLGKTTADTKVNDADRTVDVTLNFAGAAAEELEKRKKKIPF